MDMEHEDTRRHGLIGYDERTETWFVRSPESQRLMLTRLSLTHLVEMYNSVHTGRRILLVEERELRQLQEAALQAEEARAIISEVLDRRPTGLLARMAARLVARFKAPPDPSARSRPR
jgi:hypothetical protein